MRSDSLTSAKDAASKFLTAISDLEKAQPKLYQGHYVDRCKEAANVRRKSMDLTRALSDMRRV